MLRAAVPTLLRRGHVQHFSLQMTVGIAGGSAQVQYICGLLQLMALPLLGSDAARLGRLQLRLQGVDDRDVLQGEFTCMYWLRLWHIIRIVLFHWKENRNAHPSH